MRVGIQVSQDRKLISRSQLKVVIAALANDMRMQLLQTLSGEPLPASRVFAETKMMGSDVRYRETVYKGLETLVSAGLVDKKYDKKKKIIVYSLVGETLSIDLRNMVATIGRAGVI